MRIVLVCPSYYGYDDSIMRALRSLGHEVRSFGYFPHESLADKIRNRLVEEVLPRTGIGAPQALRVASFNDSVLAGVRSFDPGACIVVKGEVLTPDVLESIASLCGLAHWAFDDPYRYPNVVASLGLYRSIGSFSLANTQRLVDEGFPAFYLPDGFDSEVFGAGAAMGPSEWRRQVSFLGARYPEREARLAPVAAKYSLGIWGGDWKRRPWRVRYYQRRSTLDPCCLGQAGPKEADLIYRSCPVNLNIHGPWDGLNMRVFEIPGAGGYQLCDERSGLTDAFEPGVEIETFSSEDEMLGLVERALGDAPRRERIALAGRRRAHTEHTLRHRMKRLVDAVKR